jgi:hypothetical protein
MVEITGKKRRRTIENSGSEKDNKIRNYVIIN